MWLLNTQGWNFQVLWVLKVVNPKRLTYLNWKGHQYIHAAVCLSNWLLLNCLPWVKKLLGRWPKIGLLFICLPLAAIFLQICQFPVNLQSFWTFFQYPRTFFSSVLGIKTSKRAVNVNYPLHMPNSVIFIILWLKSTQIFEVVWC